jgi:hypothetical protein
VSSADSDPGGSFSGWQEIKFAVRELEHLAAKLSVALQADDDSGEAITWDAAAWQAADLLERAYADIGTLSGTYLRLMIADRYGRDPLA